MKFYEKEPNFSIWYRLMNMISIVECCPVVKKKKNVNLRLTDKYDTRYNVFFLYRTIRNNE